MNRYVVRETLLEKNLAQLKKLAGETPIWAVVKGDGYGLGVLPLASLLYRQGIRHFCVTELREAVLLRENGFDRAEILMLRDISQEETLQRLLELRVILTIGSGETARLAERIAATKGLPARGHLKIDTGMGRYGFLPEETTAVCSLHKELKHLEFCGIYTHFNCAANDPKKTKTEFSAFCAVVEQLRKNGLKLETAHCCNSAAFLKYPEMHLDGVRLGSALLGRLPFPSTLQPVGYACSRIETLRLLPKGHSTGYGASWSAKKETKLAIVPVGWYHGLQLAYKADIGCTRDGLRGIYLALRSALRPQRTCVEIGGKRCPIVGTIGMLHCAVDVSGVDCACGDPVILPIKPLLRKDLEVVFEP